MVGRTKLKGTAVAAVICVLAVYAGSIAAKPDKSIFLSADIYDHYAMNPADTGYFEFNPNGAGSANPTICEGKYTGLVEDQLDAEGLPVLRDHIPCTFNANLDSWFREDTINAAPKKRVIKITKEIEFKHLAADNFHLEDPDFFPLDGEPGTLVDQGIEQLVESDDHGMHNNGFTMHIQTRFTFLQASANQAGVHFTGGDDVWVFINGKLVMDFGGIHNSSPGPITLSSLIKDGIMDFQEGMDYTLDFFFAKRHTHNSNFNLIIHKQLLRPSEKNLSYYIVK